MRIEPRFLRLRALRPVWAGLLLLACLLPGARASAEPGLHSVSWMQSGADKVARFVVLVSPTAGNPQSALVIDVGKPAGTPTPVGTQFSALVSIEPDTYVAVAAIGFDGLRSAPSNWMLPVPTQPGQPRLVVE